MFPEVKPKLKFIQNWPQFQVSGSDQVRVESSSFCFDQSHLFECQQLLADRRFINDRHRAVREFFLGNYM